MSRFWRLFFLALSMLFLGLVWSVTTTSGARLLWRVALHVAPQLQGEVVEGSLWSGISLAHLRWQQQGVALGVAEVDLRWQISYLLEGKLQITSLAVKGTRLKLSSLKSEPSPPVSSDNQPFQLPFIVRLQALNVQDVQIEGQGYGLTLSVLKGQADINAEGLDVHHLLLSRLHLVTQSSPHGSPSPRYPIASSNGLLLPWVQAPLPIKVRQFQISDLSWQKDDVSQQWQRLDGVLAWNGVEVELSRFELVQGKRFVGLSAHLLLIPPYALDVELKASEPVAQLDGIWAMGHLRGDLSHLRVGLGTYGMISSEIEGHIDLQKADYPFSLQGHWQPFARTLGKRVLRMNQGELHIAGSSQRLKLKLATAFATDPMGMTPVELQLEATPERVVLDSLRLITDKGELKSSGTLTLTDGVSWQGETQLRALSLHQFDPNLSGQLSGRVASQFRLKAGHWQLNVEPMDLNGRWRGYPFLLQGAFSLDDALRWKLDRLALKTGTNRLNADGSSAQGVDVAINAPKLAVFYPELTGKLNAQLHLNQAKKLYYKVQGRALGYRDWGLGALDLSGQQHLAGHYAGHLKLMLQQLSMGEKRQKSVQLRVRGDKQQQELGLQLAGDQLSGHLKIAGQLDQSQWHGSLSRATFDTPLGHWALRKAVTIGYRLADQRLTLGELRWNSGAAFVKIMPIYASPNQVTGGFTLDGFALNRLQPWLPKKFSLSNVLAGSGTLYWRKDLGPQGEVAFRLGKGMIHSGELSASLDGASLAAKITPDQITTHIGFSSSAFGRGDVSLDLNSPFKERLLKGEMTLNALRLNWLVPLIPQLETLRGTMAAHATVGGSLQHPELKGSLTLQDAEVVPFNRMIEVRDLNATLTLLGEQARLQAHMNAGQGPLALAGQLGFGAEGISGQLTAKGENIEVDYPEVGRIQLTPDLRLELGKQIQLLGKISIPWARIQIKQLPQSAVGVSDDLLIRNKGKLESATGKQLPVSLQVKVALGDDVRLEAFDFNSHLSGQLLLAQRPNKPLSANGEIRVFEGRYRAYGQDLLIDDGQLFFSGPLDDPSLNIRAYRDPKTIVDNTKVWIELGGRAKALQISINSDPLMGNSEQLSYLLRGKGFDKEGGQDQSAILRSFLISQGIAKAGGFVSGIGNQLGLSDVALDSSGSGDKTEIAISGYITPRLQLRYGVSVFSAINEFELRYRLWPGLYVQAISGVGQALDLLYQFEF